MHKTILVTGGAGFIGSHLCEALAKDENNKVFSLDNYSTGTKKNHLSNVTYINGDTKNIASLIKFSPQIIYHLGEYSRVEQSFSDIELVWQSNIIGTFAILEFCRNHSCKLIYAGSSTKFGDEGMGKHQSPYAWTKASNTELVKNYSEWFGISYAITYFYNVYGKREIGHGKYATLIASYINKMKKSQPLTVVSPGTQKRNFTHIDDIISGLMIIGDGGVGDEYGIGNPNSYTILDVAKKFGGKIEILPPRKGNRLDAKIITRKTEDLGWKPTHNLEDYIDNLRKNNWEYS